MIGARYYNRGFASVYGTLNSTYESPRDDDGHGSHTLSTAAGNFVPGANVLGYANGTAKGGSPKARVVAYKVCWLYNGEGSCFDADVLAAVDAAIFDGVDVLSTSLGGSPGTPFFEDGIAIASFHAAKHGISVVCSAGNSGPLAGTVANVAPWQFTIGASTMDREFPAYVVLGNKLQFKVSCLTYYSTFVSVSIVVKTEHVRIFLQQKLNNALCRDKAYLRHCQTSCSIHLLALKVPKLYMPP